MAAGECPSRDELMSILDAADPVSEKQLAEHLESCEGCRTNLNQIAGVDWLTPSSLQALSAPAEVEASSLSKIVAQCERPVDAQETRYATLPNADALPFLLEPSDEPESIGRLGRFEVLRQLGRGGMGVVFLARDPTLDRQVAIKVLNPQFIGDNTAQERFLREARAAATINHRNLVTIYSVELSDSNLLLIMEYVDGESLQERLRAQGKIALPELLRVGIQVALGLSAAHAQGLVHRDIKPGNILIESASNQAKIADFGLAQIIDDPEANAAGLILGTPAYMAPEQAQGHEVDNRADLFSLGSVLFAMHTGRPPYEGPTMNVLRQVAEGPPSSLEAIDPDVPAWLNDLVTHLHAFHREDRLTSATDVARILKAQLDALRQSGGSQGLIAAHTIAAAPATLGILGPEIDRNDPLARADRIGPAATALCTGPFDDQSAALIWHQSHVASTAACRLPPRFTPGGPSGLSSPIVHAVVFRHAGTTDHGAAHPTAAARRSGGRVCDADNDRATPTRAATHEKVVAGIQIARRHHSIVGASRRGRWPEAEGRIFHERDPVYGLRRGRHGPRQLRGPGGSRRARSERRYINDSRQRCLSFRSNPDSRQGADHQGRRPQSSPICGFAGGSNRLARDRCSAHTRRARHRQHSARCEHWYSQPV